MTESKAVPKLLLLLPLMLLALLGLLYWQGLTFDPNQAPSRLIGKPVPTFSLPALVSTEVMLNSQTIKGPALINVWASWCAACREEHELLMQIAKQEGIAIYGVDYQDDADTARAWLNHAGNPYTWVMFDGASVLSRDLDIFSLPQTYTVDAQGIIRARHVGALTPDIWQVLRTQLFTNPI